MGRTLFDDYEGFVEKFKPKKTTDDCFTPPLVYDAVAGWVADEYGVDLACFVRPFWPGGNYQEYDYRAGSVVVDNPPFSILAEILQFYKQQRQRFFLFAPAMTLFSSSSSSCTALVVGGDVIYENGAIVKTSFLTNMEPGVRFRTEPRLYKVLQEAVKKTRKEQKKELPRYEYPLEVVSAAYLHPYARLGIDFCVRDDECIRIGSLDAQKSKGKSIFGNGYLINSERKAEREKAEREKAEREKAERWELSERERALIRRLDYGKAQEKF